jgi:outer membrane protein
VVAKKILFAWVFVPVSVVAQQTAPARRAPAELTEVPAPAQVPTVTLDDAIKLALRVQPSVVTATGNVDVAHAQQRQAIGNWLPTVNLSSGLIRRFTANQALNTGALQQTNNAFSYTAGLNASVTLFDFGRRLFQNRQMNANAGAMEAALVNQKFQVTLQTKQAFFNALAAVDLERVATTAVQRADEQLKITREKLAAGSAIRSDTLSATVTLGQAKLQVLNAQAQRATQEANLARLIGFDGRVAPLGDSAVVAVIDVDTVAVRTEALRSSPVVSQADAQLRLAESVVNANRTNYLPTLTASYNNTRVGQGGSWTGGFNFGGLTPTSSLSMTLSWPIFNGFVRETNLTSASASREAAEASAADQRRVVNAQVTQYLAALRSAQISLSIAQASREAADESLRVQRERYRLGAATIVDVLNAQQQLDQSEVDAVNARVSYQIARAQLEALLGRSL